MIADEPAFAAARTNAEPMIRDEPAHDHEDPLNDPWVVTSVAIAAPA